MVAADDAGPGSKSAWLFEDFRREPESQEVWKAMAEHWKGPAYRMAFRMVGDHHQAEELVQEFFLKLMQAPPRLGLKNGSLRPWLREVVGNMARNLRKRGARQRPWTDGMTEELEQERFVDDMLADVARQEALDRTRREIESLRIAFREAESRLRRTSKLADTTWECFFAIERDGKDEPEVEQRFGLKPGTAGRYRRRVGHALLEAMGFGAEDNADLRVFELIFRQE